MTKLPKETLIFLLFPLLLTQLPLAHAGGNAAPININIDLSGVINAVNNAYNGVTGQINGINQAIAGLAQKIVEALFTFIQNLLIDFTTSLIDLEENMVTTNPDVTPMLGTWTLVVTIISSLYLIVFLITGFMFLIGSIDSEARASAKNWIKNSIYMIFTVSISFEAYKILLELCTAITQYLAQDTNFVQAGALDTINILLLTLLSTATVLSFITLFLRYLFLLCGAALFPIALFFYFVPPLKPWGSILLNLIGAALLMQIIDIVIFIACGLVWQQFPGNNIMSGLAPTMAFLMIGAINTLVILFALVKASLSALQTSPTLNTVVKVIAKPVVEAGKLALAAA